MLLIRLRAIHIPGSAKKAIQQYDMFLHSPGDSKLANKARESLHIVIALGNYQITNSVRKYAGMEINALKTYFSDVHSDPDQKGFVLRMLAEAYIQTGQFQKARLAADTLIFLSKQFPGSEDLFIANEVLGLISLHNNNISNADRYLLAAGNVPSSHTINAWAPNVRLVHALMKDGQWQPGITFCHEIERKQHLNLNSWLHDFQNSKIPEMTSSLR